MHFSLYLSKQFIYLNTFNIEVADMCLLDNQGPTIMKDVLFTKFVIFSSHIDFKLCNTWCVSFYCVYTYLSFICRFGAYQKEPVNMFLMATLLLSDVYPCMEILVIVVVDLCTCVYHKTSLNVYNTLNTWINFYIVNPSILILYLKAIMCLVIFINCVFVCTCVFI